VLSGAWIYTLKTAPDVFLIFVSATIAVTY